MMPHPPQQRGNGIPRGHLPSKQRPSTSVCRPSKTNASASTSRSYYSMEELWRLREIITERKVEVLENIGISNEILKGGPIQTYGLHQDFGTEVQEREKAAMISSSMGKFGTALIRSEQMLKKVISFVEQQNSPRVSVSSIIKKLGNGNIYGLCVECHKLIPFGRMEAVPNANRCVGCKNGSV